ncbi:MAG: Gfo/Idh/MocA family oxidoreductase [bacterium]
MAGIVRVGIVGCGRIAEADHVQAYIGVKDCKVTALCDIRKDRTDGMKAKNPDFKDAACFSKAADLFKSGLVDAVSICTPNDCHFPQTVAACKAGLHVLCEKPMAGTLEQATKMIQAASKAKVVLQINQSLRYNAQYMALVNLVRSGAIGEPFHVRCIRACNGTPNVTWSPGADWFVQKKHEGGMLVDIGIHMADVMRMIMGDADKVAGFLDIRLKTIDVPDNVNALYRFKNGGTGVLELSWTLPGGAGFLEVYGTKGRIRLGFSDKGVELWKDGEKAETATTYPEAKPLKNSQATFVDAVRGKGRTLTPGEYGRRALALCLAIKESSARGTFAKVKHFKGYDKL